MADKKLSMEEMQKQLEELYAKEQAREERERRLKENYFALGGAVTKIKLSKGKQIFNKVKEGDKFVNGTPVLDQEGAPTFYDDSYYVEVGFVGGSESFKFDVISVQNFKEGDEVSVYGRIGKYGLEPHGIDKL